MPKLPNKKRTKAFMEEFKAFAIKGNVIDLAIGVIIGGAFSGITTSLINDVVMPFVGMFLGGIDFSEWVIMLPALFAGDEPTPLNIGNFIQTVVNFFILAAVVFIFVKLINKLRAKKEAEEAVPAPPPAPSDEVVLLGEIRDLLRESAGASAVGAVDEMPDAAGESDSAARAGGD